MVAIRNEKKKEVYSFSVNPKWLPLYTQRQAVQCSLMQLVVSVYSAATVNKYWYGDIHLPSFEFEFRL